jgi:hypothetical protein
LDLFYDRTQQGYNRDMDASGQTHKWTGTQTDRNRDTDGQRERQGHRRTGTRTEPETIRIKDKVIFNSQDYIDLPRTGLGKW